MPFADATHFARAAAAVDDILAALTDAQWSAPSPCTGWTVTDVTEHLVDVNRSFAHQLHPRSPAAPADQTPTSSTLDRYRAATYALQHALASTGNDTGLPTQLRSRLALRVADLLIHGWDIATASGQAVDLPDDLTTQALTFVLTRRAALQRGGHFGPPQPADDHARAIDRLAALSGRTIPAR